MNFILGNNMFIEELREVKEYREEVKRDYAEYQKELNNDCELACTLPTQDLAMFMLKAAVYICACNLDVENVERVYDLARERALLSNDYTIHDFVIGSCYERGDIVTAFRWVLQVNQGMEDALRLSIGASLANFKDHPNLPLVYTDLLNTLIEEYLPREEGTSSFAVRDAIVVLLSRLLRFPELIQLIEDEKTPSLLYCRLWLEHKWECANLQIESLENLFNNATLYWRKLSEICLKKQDAIQEIGRLYYPMKWYLAHQEDEGQTFFEKILVSLLYVNHHITRIKEMLNMPLGLFRPGKHITMYMRPRKFERVFTPKKGTNKVYWSLTCADHMNDDSEGVAFFDYLKECGVSLFNESIFQFGLIDRDERAAVFLGSVGQTFDDNYMYELYATDQGERGFCVDIDVRSFDNIIEDSLANDEYEWICPLYRLLYANKIDDIIMPNVKEEIKKLSRNLLTIGLFAQDFKKKHKESELSFTKMLYQMLEEIIYLFKKKEGPDYTVNDKDGSPVIRNWEREQEMRMVKCVRGESRNIVKSEKCDKQNRPYLNYVTQKRIIVKDIRGGANTEKLLEAKKHISELQKDLSYYS